MNFNYKESLNKNEKQDSNSELKASQSNANHQTTSLESVEQQTIIKSTNGTAKKQTKPYTHPHSIENILRKHDDARSLTTEHLKKNTQQKSVTIQHHVNFERPGPSQFQNLQTAEPLEQYHATEVNTEASKQHPLRNKESLPHKPHTQLDMPFTSQTATLCSNQHPQNKRQKIAFHQQYVPVLDLPQPQNLPTGVSLLNKELVVRRETPMTQQETYYTHLKLTKPQTQSQIQESAQTQLRKQRLLDQDVSQFRLVLPRDRQEQLALQQLLQGHISINISPNPPQVQLPFYEHQRDCLPSYQGPSNSKSSNSIVNQRSQSTNLLLNISSQLSQFQTSSLDSSSHLTQSQTSLLNISNQLTQPQTSPFLSSSQQSQKDTQLNREQASRESVFPGDLQSLEVPNLLLDISSQLSQSQTSSLDSTSQLTQSQTSLMNISSQSPKSQTSPFLRSSQRSQKDTQPNSEQASSESVSSGDLQSSEDSGLQMSQSPNLLLDISNLLTRPEISQFLSSSQQSQKDTRLNPEQASSENVLPCDLQLLEASDLTPEIEQTIEDLLDSYLTSCNKN